MHLRRDICDGRNTLALLGAFCFFLSAIEYLIPKPLPFMRIGLANLPLLLALSILGTKDFFLLVLLKVIGQGLIGGTFLSFIFLFSIAGTFTSATVMYALGRLSSFGFGKGPGKRYLGFAGIGCAGAMVSNGVQLILARYMVFGEAVRYLAPPFLAAGFVTGISLGIICEYFCRRSLWYASRTGNMDRLQTEATADYRGGEGRLSRGEEPAKPLPREERRLRRSRRWDGLFNADELFVAGLLMALIFLYDRSLLGHFVQFLFFCLLVWFSGRKNNLLATVVFIAGIVFFNLLVPHGRVFFALGPLEITQGSLLSGLKRAFTLSGLMMLSRACVKNDLRLPGSLGSLLAKALRMLELMRKKIPLIRRGHVFAGIDGMMLEMETANLGGPGDIPQKKPRRNIKGILLLGAMVILTAAMGLWIPFALPA